MCFVMHTLFLAMENIIYLQISSFPSICLEYKNKLMVRQSCSAYICEGLLFKLKQLPMFILTCSIHINNLKRMWAEISLVLISMGQKMTTAKNWKNEFSQSRPNLNSSHAMVAQACCEVIDWLALAALGVSSDTARAGQNHRWTVAPQGTPIWNFVAAHTCPLAAREEACAPGHGLFLRKGPAWPSYPPGEVGMTISYSCTPWPSPSQ